jgi:thioredoxin-like negative regulator of GroEL/pimeloyl-ACP methyl ester carboxylesterase
MVDQAQAPVPSPGIQAYKTKDFAQAIMLLNGEVQADPTDAKLKLYLGLSYFGANNHAEAKNVLIPLRTECNDGALKEKLESVLSQIEKALASPTGNDEAPSSEQAPKVSTETQKANFAEALAFLNEGDAGAGFGTVAPASVKAEVLPAFAERQAAKEAAEHEAAASTPAVDVTVDLPVIDPASSEPAVEAPKRVPPEEQLSDDDPIVNSGLNMYNQGDYEGCAKVLKRRITQIPHHWKARLYLGRCQHLLHDYLAAERTLSFLLTNSDSEEARVTADAEISKFRSAMRAAEPKLEAQAQPRPAAEVIRERTPVDSFPAVEEPKPEKPKVQVQLSREQIAGILAVVLLGVLVYMGVGMYVTNSNLYQSTFLQPTPGQDLPAQDMEIMGVKGELLELTGAAGSKLSAVIYRKPDAKHIAIINHDFDGNMNSRIDYVRLFLKADMSVILYDYGGFGKSTGEATLGHIGGEGFLVADYLQGREGIEAENMVFFGEYLGCAVAEQMGKYRPNSAVILHGPFSSYTDLIREKYPFLNMYSDDTIPSPHGDAEPFLKSHTTPVLLVSAPNKNMIKRDMVDKLLPKTIDVKNKYDLPDYSGPMPDSVQDAYAEAIKQFVHDYLQ